MSVRNTLYHATVKGMRKLSSARMDLPDVDMKTDLVRARVVRNQELATPHSDSTGVCLCDINRSR